MKTLYITIITLFLFTGAYAQETAKVDSASVVKLKTFLSGHILPVAVSVENNVQGVTIVGFKIDENKNITDVHVVKSLSPEFDAEVLREFQKYHQTILLPPSEYIAGVWLMIDNKKPKQPITPVDKSLYPNYLFDVTVNVHLNF